MKRFLHVIMLLGVLMVGAAFLFHPSVAESANDEVRFVDGVIEVPEGTTVIFDDDSETVIIKECPVDIQKGDTFVVYLKELPIGYVAKSIDVRNDETIISVQKADKSVYANFEKEGSIELTPDMYTFIPAEGISYMEGTTQSGISIGGGDGLGYSNGKLTLSKSFGGNKIQMSLSNLSINYAASDGNMSLSLGGKWELSTPAMSVSEDILDDIPCGQIRIAGIGKISIKMSMKIGMSMTCNFSGSFRVGFSMASGNADSIIREFSCDSKKVSGKGKISASLKVTAGIDVVFASADIYGAVGVATELDTKSTTDQNTHKTTSCANYRIYVFLEAGAEAKVFSPISGDLKPVYGYDFNIPDNIAKPYSIDIHFENGSLVGNCTKGMSIPDRSFGGFSTSFGSTILTDSRMRILESKVSLPWDTIVDNDLFVANGNLRLNGHTLTIKGNLIQSGGTITVEDGTLIVEGDYRIQTLDQETGVFAGSTGSLIMKNEEGKVIVSGDVVIQTKSSDNKLDYGTISVGKNLYQKNEDGNSVNLKASANCHIVMSGGNSHSIVLDNPEGNYLGTLHVLGNTTIPHSMHLDGAQIIESTLRIQGDLRLEGGVLELQNGELDVTGNFCIEESDGDASSGILSMTHEKDIVRVGGMFRTYSAGDHSEYLTAGTLYVAGDFYEKSNGYWGSPGNARLNYAASEGHKTVLNGSGQQIVSFESERSHFGTFEATNTDLVFSGYFSWKKMNCDITAKTDGTWPKTSVSLNGHKLTIEGDLIFESGVLDIDGGELDVTGNFCIEESDGDASSGILSMTHEKDIVRVGGMFRTYSAGDHSEYLTAGTLYVAGDFYEKSNGYWGSPGNARLNYAASEGHKTVLNGSGQQTVSFESEKSHFGTFEATNTDLVFSGYFSWKKMNCDITAKTDGTWLKTSVSLNGHKLTIEGDLIFRSGVLNIDGGELDVTGDFRITDPGSRSGVSNGILSMTHENDVVRVEGTFRMFSGNDHSEYLTAGTLYVAGDFYQVSQGYSGTSCNYAASEGHKTVLNGSGQQIVSFEREESHFGTLIIKRPIDQYQFKPNPCWITLVPDSASLFATADFSLPRALTGIEEASFEGVTAEIVFIPDDCETIEANAFQNSSVKWIRIPKDCVLGEDVFAGCEKVYIYSVAGSNAEDYCRSHENCIFIEE